MSSPDTERPRQSGKDDEADAPEPADGQTRPGLPDPSTVVAEETMTSPKGRRYRILRTRQIDAYEDVAEADAERSQERGAKTSGRCHLT
jgi:hypothetical protein